MANIEVICVNDGSKNDSLRLLHDYQVREPRMKVIDQSNSGVSVARNTGIEHATGKWIMFVDADDYIVNLCDRLVSEAENNAADIAVFGLKRESRSDELNFTRLKTIFTIPRVFTGLYWILTLYLSVPLVAKFSRRP